MNQVTVLGVLEAEQRTVGREAAARETALVDASEPNGFSGAIHLGRASTVETDVDRESVAIADAGGDDPRRLGEPFVPAVRDAFEECSSRSSEEGLHEPASGFVSGRVVEPEHAFSVERR